MKEYFEVYIQNQDKIEEFIEESLNKFGEVKKHKSSKFKTLLKFSIFRACLYCKQRYKGSNFS